MTIYELHLRFLDIVDKLASNVYAEIPIEQRDRIFNNAIDRFVKQRYGINNAKREGFEVTQKRTDDLSNLVVYTKIDKLTSGFFQDSNIATTYFKIPTDYWFSIVERVNCDFPPCPKFKYTNKCGKINKEENPLKRESVLVHSRRHNEINTLLLDPFNKPQDREMFRVMTNGDIEDENSYNMIQLFHDKTVAPIEYELGYIKKYKPLKVGSTYNVTDKNSSLYWKNLEFWFNNETHQEIIDIAASLAIEITENPRYQTFKNETITQE